MKSSSHSDSSLSHLHPLGFVLQLLPSVGRAFTLLVAAAASLLLLQLFRPSLETLEEQLGALGWTLNPDTTLEERIILVSIDEKSLAGIGPWPWPRAEMARLVRAIDLGGAQLQLHDIIYADLQPDDAVLLSALQASPGAVLAQVPVLQSEQLLRTGTLSHPVSGVACDAASGGSQIPATASFLAPHSGFAAIPKGHISAIIASDGAIRKVPALVCVDEAAYPALALTALLQASNRLDWKVSLQAGDAFFGPAQKLQFNAYPGLSIPLDQQGNLRISYANSPTVYQAISAVDLMNGEVDASILENAWVLVGATAFSMDDNVPTPYNGATPGVELSARLLGSVLDVAIPYTPLGASWITAFFTAIFAMLLYGLATLRGRLAAYGLPLAALALPVIALGIHLQLLSSANIWLGWVYPALYSIVAAGLLVLLELSRVRLERSRVFSNLQSYLPGAIAREIAYSLPSSTINAKRCNVTLLNADLRNFSAFGEARPPEESAAVLHFFFTRATEIVESHGGKIHEFRGDGLLAIWDGHNSADAEMALNAAQALQAALHHSLLPEHAPPGLEPLALGIGIEQGPALLGSIGPAHRRSHTLLGDTVTITLRIQEMTADLAQPILLGECVARQLSDHKLESQGSYLLAGLKTPHVLFALPPTDAIRHATLPAQPSLKVLSGGRH